MTFQGGGPPIGGGPPMGGAHAQRCRVCAAEVPADAVRCPRCDAALGAHDPCPSCRAQAGASPHAELRYVCDVCGAPRVPRFDKSIRYSGREGALLRKADGARKARALWRGASVAGGLLLLFTLVVSSGLLLLIGAKAVLLLFALLATGTAGAFTAFSVGRAGAQGRAIQPALDAAWLSVATDVAQQTEGLTAGTLASKLGLAEPQAEELMALLDVNGVMSPAPRLRIDSAPARPPVATPSPSQAAAAEEDAAIAEQAAADARARGKP